MSTEGERCPLGLVVHAVSSGSRNRPHGDELYIPRAARLQPKARNPNRIRSHLTLRDAFTVGGPSARLYHLIGHGAPIDQCANTKRRARTESIGIVQRNQLCRIAEGDAIRCVRRREHCPSTLDTDQRLHVLGVALVGRVAELSRGLPRGENLRQPFLAQIAIELRARETDGSWLEGGAQHVRPRLVARDAPMALLSTVCPAPAVRMRAAGP